MKQYCRYCINLAAGNGTYCEAHETDMSDSAAKRLNHCKDFDFCEIDAFAENLAGYHPREPYRTRKNVATQGDQLTMFGKESQ